LVYDSRDIQEVLMWRTLRTAFVNLAILGFVFAPSAFAKKDARNVAPSSARQNAAQQPPRQLAPLPPGYIRPPMNVPTGLAPKMHVEELPTADSHTYEVRFGTGDEIMSGLYQFAEQHHVVSAHITGIGGLISAKLGWGSPTVPGMKEIDVNSKCELVSLIGNISEVRGHPYVHLHGVVAFSDGSTKGGHVIEARVDPIAEIYVVTTAAPLPGPTPGPPGH
jgi:uncharacterized protein